jgi:hypothetical protein
VANWFPFFANAFLTLWHSDIKRVIVNYVLIWWLWKQWSPNPSSIFNNIFVICRMISLFPYSLVCWVWSCRRLRILSLFWKFIFLIVSIREYRHSVLPLRWMLAYFQLILIARSRLRSFFFCLWQLLLSLRDNTLFLCLAGTFSLKLFLGNITISHEIVDHLILKEFLTILTWITRRWITRNMSLKMLIRTDLLLNSSFGILISFSFSHLRLGRIVSYWGGWSCERTWFFINWGFLLLRIWWWTL